PGGDVHRRRDLLKPHLDERIPLNIFHPDGVERDVDASGLLGYFGDVLLDGRSVESVDLRGLGRSSRGGDIPGHWVKLCKGATREKKPCPLAGEGTGHRAADRSTGSVDHGTLILEQHFHP